MSDLTPDLRSTPDEVLEAAAEAMFDADFGSIAVVPWDLADERLRAMYRKGIRAAYSILAHWVTARVLDEAAHQIRSGNQSRDPYEREAVGYVVDQLQQFANEAEAAVES